MKRVYRRARHRAARNAAQHNFTDIRKFNLMFKTFQGVTEDAKNELYLRPETAQGIFVNFANIQRTTRKKDPLRRVPRSARAFRNEITPGNFTFRTREFEQMELEFFCKPGTDLEWFYLTGRTTAKTGCSHLGMKEENLRLRDHEQEELSFYSKATTDIEFLFPFGWGELWGIADRTDYDLGQHSEHSGVKAWNTSIRNPTSTISPMSSSRPWARTGWPWPSCATHMTRKWWTPKRTTPAWCCVSTRRWPPSRRRCCPCPKS